MAENGLLDRARPAAFAVFLALAALPTLVFGLLVGTREMHLLPGLCAWAICSAVAVGFGILLGRDIMVMTRLVRALQSSPAELPRETRFLVPGMRSLGQEALRLIRAERLIRSRIVDSAAEDRALVERLPDPLIKLDAEGNVLWRNATAAATFGNDSAALLRHPILRAALVEAAQAGHPVRRKLSTAVPVPRDLDATIIPVGGPAYVLITDRTHERALEKMRADFIANSSHELRTPLASLIGFIETLRGPAADDQAAQQRFLAIMAEQSARMQRLIDDLLNLSRIEISEHQPPEELQDLTALLERILAAMEPMLKAGNTKITVSVPADLPAIPADADQLTQVFTNLLDNALKYGKPGGCIKFTAARAVGDSRFEPNGVLVSVADDGVGIPRDHIPRLTERFYRVDKGRSRAVGGTGLGLAIVKHVVNRHRGRLMIESAEGQGTTFTVWLPTRRG
jgi:two-component system phosphate regulon sensor histidine kinase PhoR